MMNEELLKRRLNGMTIGRNKASEIVGGLARLKGLVACGKIRTMKDKKNAQNAKWYLDLYEVLTYAQ